MAILPLRETVDSESPCNVSCGPEDAKVTRMFTFGKQKTGTTTSDPPVTDQKDIIDTLNALVGATSTATLNPPTTTVLPRTVPFADAEFPTWYVRSVDSLKGIGQPVSTQGRTLLDMAPAGSTPQQIASLALQAPALPSFALYPTYRISCTFGPRPYAVLQDGAISTIGALTWTKSSGTQTQTFNSLTNEWIRYTDFSGAPQNDYVSQANAQMQLRGIAAAGANGVPFVGDRRMFLPNSIVKLNWWQVPLRYVLSPNSYLRSLRGYVNQFDFYDCPTLSGAKIWPKGSLLYLNYSYTQYSSPLANFMPWVGNFLTPSKLVNVELQFLQTDRVVTNAPAPTNANYITAGHNALPWLGGATKVGGNLNPIAGGRKFYYATTGGDNGQPSFFSAPFELLFTDPDANPPNGDPF